MASERDRLILEAIQLIVNEIHNQPTTSQWFRDQWEDLAARIANAPDPS